MSFTGSDETLTCKGCNNEFVFTVGEQAFFTRMAFDEKPKRCKTCQALKKARNGQQSGYNASGGYSAGGSTPGPSAPAPIAQPHDEEPSRRPRKDRRRNRDDDGFEYENFRLLMHCPECGSDRIVSIYSECRKCSVNISGLRYAGNVPDDLNIGGDELVSFEYCAECGQIQADFPLDITNIENDAILAVEPD